MLNKLRVSRSATFYKKGRKSLTNEVVTQIFREVSKDKVGNYTARIIRSPRTVENLELKVSFLTFAFEEDPSFLVASGLREKKYAFLLILEVRDQIIVLKKSISGLESLLRKYTRKMDYEQIQYLFADEEASYEKMTTSSMSMSKAAIRRKTLEADDLKGQISAQSSRRSIPTNTTIRTAKHRHILRPNSSSVAKIDAKSDFSQISAWSIEICDQLRLPLVANAFLDNFAKPVTFEVIQSLPLTPSAVILNIGDLKDKIGSGAELLFRDRPLKGARIHSILSKLDSILLVTPSGGSYALTELSSGLPRGELKLNAKSITLASPWLKELALKDEDGHSVSLANYINYQQLFTVTFDSPEYIYTTRKVFRDRGIGTHLAEIIAALDVSVPTTLTSEKGDPYGRNQTAFAPASVFGHLETNLREPGSVLVCDDLGDEWADFIEFSTAKSKIRLLHCKHASVTTSATQLHDVVSQAVKNLGRVSFTEPDLDRKIASWRDPFVGSSIARIRSGHNSQALKQRALDVMRSPDIEREVGIVVPFVSRNELIRIQTNLLAGTRLQNHEPQMIWLLSTLVFACKESGIQPKIYCST